MSNSTGQKQNAMTFHDTTHVDLNIGSVDSQRPGRIIASGGRGGQVIRDDGLVVRVRRAVSRVSVDGEFGGARGDVHLLGVGALVDEDALVGCRGRREGVDSRLNRRVRTPALSHV